MKLLLLSGNSKSNEVWIKEVADKFANRFDEIKIASYEHWQTGQELINFEKERLKLKELVGGWNEYLIFAKSVGTLLTLAGIKDGILKPKGVLMCGIPRSFADRVHFEEVDKCWQDVSCPITVLQNDQDPVGGYDSVKEYLQKYYPNASLVKTVGNTHDYLDLELMKRELQKLI